VAVCDRVVAGDVTAAVVTLSVCLSVGRTVSSVVGQLVS